MGIERAIEINKQIEALQVWFSNYSDKHAISTCRVEVTSLSYSYERHHQDNRGKAPAWFSDAVQCELYQKIEEAIKTTYEKEMKRLKEELFKEREAINEIFSGLF